MAHRVYHWRHGWIPLDHMAALSKAKGSEHGARKYLASSHAAGHAHGSVVEGSYGGGTHVRGLQPVAGEHLPRDRHITAAFNPTSRRFALHDARGRATITGDYTGQELTTSIPEHLGKYFHERGYTITGLTDRGGVDRVEVRNPTGGSKRFRADGSDIGDVDPHIVDPPTTAGAGENGASSYLATHTITTNNRFGKDYGVIKPVSGLGGLDIIDIGLATHLNENGMKVIGYERKVITTVGADGVIRRFKADGSNINKPVIAKKTANALRDIGDWKALNPTEVVADYNKFTDQPVNAWKVKRAYRRGNHKVLIETDLNHAETEAFLGHVDGAITASGLGHGVTFRVPKGDPGMRTANAYVYRGDTTTVHINPNIAAKSVNSAARGDSTGHSMSAAAGVHPTLFTITHELGHITDFKHAHTFENPSRGLTNPEATALHRKYNRAYAQRDRTGHIIPLPDGNLAAYGSSKPVEGYAEAFAHFHLMQQSDTPTLPEHDKAAQAYAKHYGWQRKAKRT